MHSFCDTKLVIVLCCFCLFVYFLILFFSLTPGICKETEELVYIYCNEFLFPKGGSYTLMLKTKI